MVFFLDISIIKDLELLSFFLKKERKRSLTFKIPLIRVVVDSVSLDLPQVSGQNLLSRILVPSASPREASWCSCEGPAG